MGTSRYERFARGVALAAAAGLPLVCAPFLRDAYLIPKLAAAGLCLTLAAAAFILGRVRSEGARGLTPVASRVDAPLAAFCAVAVVSAAASVDGSLSWFGPDQYTLLGLPGLAACVGAFYLGCAVRRGPEGEGEPPGGGERLIRWMSAASVPVSVYAVAQALGFDPLFRNGGAPAVRPGSTFGVPTHLGAYLAMVTPLALHQALGGKAGTRQQPRALGLTALVFGLPALALSGSRGAWIGAAGGVLVYLLLCRRLMRTSGAANPAVLRRAAVVVLPAVLLGGFFAAGSFRRVAAHVRAADTARVMAWRIAFEEFRQRPWLGSGPGTFTIGFRRRRSEESARVTNVVISFGHAHNDWLEILATMGLAGIACYLWLHVAAFRAAGAALAGAQRRVVAALLAAVVAVLVHAKFNSPSLGVAWPAALLAGFSLADSPRGRRPEGSLAALSRMGGVCLLVCSALWTAFVGAGMLAGDRCDLLGRRARREGRPREAAGHYERALAFRPGTLAYRFDLMNLLWDAAGGAGPEERRVLLRRAAEIALEGVRRRPHEAEMHRLLGLAELRRFRWAGEDRLGEARKALEAAVLLHPTYSPALKELGEAAALQGDAARREELERRLERIGGVPVGELLPAEKIETMTRRAREEGATGRPSGRDPICRTPAGAAAEMVEAILEDKKKVMPCAVRLEGEYGVDGIFLGVPVKLGARGAEAVIQINLTVGERIALQKAAGIGRESARALG
ncbi:MAG: O-antigen ligase family protein [Elusimicrobiota bacterium]